MNTRASTIAAVAVISVVGFAIGGWLAVISRPNEHVSAVSTATTIRTPVAVRTAAPTAATTEAPTTKPVPTQTQTHMQTQTPSAGSWELDEANAQVGTIVWAADVALTPGKSVVLNAHKQSVGGHPAVPCERQTSLHAEFSAGTAAQSVPFREVNCEGVATTGEMRVTSVPGNGASFSGSFWRDGVKLGDFSARRR
jgi:hypothetical protein